MEGPSAIDLTISSIWVEERISCPRRETLVKFVGGTLDIDTADYIQFHIRKIGCPFCQASEEDLRLKKGGHTSENEIRDRLFEKTSAYLKKKKG